MGNLKDIFLEIDTAESNEFLDNSIEVYADSVKQALEIAAREFNVDVSSLDYEVIEKGTKGLFGIGRLPYRVIVTSIVTSEEYENVDDLETKFASGYSPGVSLNDKKNVDGEFSVRVSKTGIWLNVSKSKGNGKAVTIDDVEDKCNNLRINNYDKSAIAKAVKKADSEKIKIGEWSPNSSLDSTMRVEISEDELRAYVYINPPKFSGRHMDYDDIIDALKNSGVIIGIKENEIKEYLNTMDYKKPLLAAEGQMPYDGKNAYIDYKVNIDKSSIKFEEDETGKVDFLNLELLENVVIGQLLAVKVPLEEGVPGRTVTNRVLPAKSGKDTAIKYGEGTILLENGNKLTAEINGQVVFTNGKISVEPVFVVQGDVSLETGNIVFLGSVIVQGSVLDNFEVKAAGNIEVKGTVQKAFIEAEGDVIVHQGISGKDEARVESTGGSIFAKFAQNSNIVAERSVVIPEGILHCRVDAGEKIYSIGRRAKIAGGVIRATEEVNAGFFGAEGSTRTVIRVGVNPKMLQQMDDLTEAKKGFDDELNALRLDLKTLNTQKRNSGGKLSEEKEKTLTDLTAREEKQSARLAEVTEELEELNQYMNLLEHKGKACADKIAYSGVEIYIKDKEFRVKDDYKHVTFSLKNNEIDISNYEEPVFIEGSQRMTTVVKKGK
ncbi:MAG: FapA family protein [Leptospirales bacterium]|nr:FapA family protein [Leptospirales bacterium]